jgi:hypothetical protein
MVARAGNAIAMDTVQSKRKSNPFLMCFLPSLSIIEPIFIGLCEATARRKTGARLAGLVID